MADDAGPPGDLFGLPGPDAAPAKRRVRGPEDILPARPPLTRPAGLDTLPGRLRLGTSTWSFPGWRGLVWADDIAESALSRHGLRAYSRHPLLDAVGVDRGFYAPVPVAAWQAYAAQVPEDFRFVVKAPASVTDAFARGADGRGRTPNPHHLDAARALDEFVLPCREGLGERLGWLVFQFSPLPGEWLRGPREWIERLGGFLERMPADAPVAVEVRDPELLTPRLVRTLRDGRALPCLGLHDRMPPVERQLAALDAWSEGRPAPLLARWTLHRGIGYEAARTRYAPFDRLVDEDPATRLPLAAHAARMLAAGQPVTVIANNKAEGSAPLTLQRFARAVADAAGFSADAAGT